MTQERMSEADWREIPGTAGKYHASSSGQIRGPRGVLKPRPDRKGYPRVCVIMQNKRSSRAVSRLVLLAFAGIPAPGSHAAHINGDKKNNSVTNLMWASPFINKQHQFDHGTVARGNTSNLSKLTEDEVRDIVRRYRRTGPRGNGAELAKEYGVLRSAVTEIIAGYAWNHVTGIPVKRRKPGARYIAREALKQIGKVGA